MTSLIPGTYIIMDTDSTRALSYYHFAPFSHKIGTWDSHRGEYQKWYIKQYPDSPAYAIQNVEHNIYIAIGVDRRDAHGVEEDDAVALDLERQSNGHYQYISTCSQVVQPVLILGYKNKGEWNDKLFGAPQFSTDGARPYPGVNFTDKVPAQNHAWKFEKIGDDTNGTLKPKPGSPTPASLPQSSNLLSSNSGSLYTDDAHFYTDLLFNMPRTPFTRTQRIAALDWARRLGATNVPTMESFDECERRLEAASGSNNNTNPTE